MVFHLGSSSRAVAEDVGDQAQRGRRRVDVGAAGDVLLEHVVLDGPGERRAGDALLLGDDLVGQQQDGRRGVDRHRRRDLVQRDAVEQGPHVVDRVDGHADLADLARCERVVGVVAHLRRQVERDRQAGLAGAEQLVVAGVGLRGRAEPGVLAHGPGPAGVHRRVDAAGVGILPGGTDQGGVGTGARLGVVEGGERTSGLGDCHGPKARPGQHGSRAAPRPVQAPATRIWVRLAASGQQPFQVREARRWVRTEPWRRLVGDLWTVVGVKGRWRRRSRGAKEERERAIRPCAAARKPPKARPWSARTSRHVRRDLRRARSGASSIQGDGTGSTRVCSRSVPSPLGSSHGSGRRT